MPEHGNFRLEVEIAAYDEHQELEHTPRQQVDETTKHPAIMPERSVSPAAEPQVSGANPIPEPDRRNREPLLPC